MDFLSDCAKQAQQLKKRSRAWFGTLNNPTPADLAFYSSKDNFTDATAYICSAEHAPTTGTLHLHVYIRLPNPISFQSLLKRYTTPGTRPRADWQPARGSDVDSRSYLHKEGARVLLELGEFRQQRPGTRSDLTEIRDQILSGIPLSEVIQGCSNYQQLRFAEGLAKYAPCSKDARIVSWYYGPSGTGKTFTAVNSCPPDNTWVGAPPYSFFNGYSGQTHVVLDDLRANDIPFNLLLRMFDPYPLFVNVKGASVPWRARHIYITTPWHPKQFCFGEEKFQLERRLTEIKLFEAPKYAPQVLQIPQRQEILSSSPDLSPEIPTSSSYVQRTHSSEEVVPDEVLHSPPT